MALYDIFLSHASADKPAVERLARKLRENGVNPFFDSWHLTPGKSWIKELNEALSQSSTCAVFIGRNSGGGAWRTREMELALVRATRDESFRVIPVLLPEGDESALEELSGFLGLQTWVDFRADLEEPEAFRRLIAGIQGEPPGPGEKTALPSLFDRGAEKPYRFIGPKTRDRFIHRREYEEAVQALLGSGGDRGTTVGLTTALQGAGGFGKTALALELCHDPRIRKRYLDGILWAQMRDNMSPDDRLKEIRDLLRRWTNQDPPSFETVAQAGQHLTDLLKGKNVLLVVDDAWRLEDVTPFQGLDANAALLITTRDRRTLPDETVPIRVDAMEESEAIRLLGDGILVDDPEILKKFSMRLGEWPILLKLVNSQLREMIREDGFSFGLATRRIEAAFKEEGITALDRNDIGVRNAAVARTVEVSLERLGDDADRFCQLAICPEDESIPLFILGRLWGLGTFQTERLCARLYDLSLFLHFDRQVGVIRLHDVIRAYLIRKGKADLQKWHSSLLAASLPASGSWADLPREEKYLWNYLLHHLIGAGQVELCWMLLLNIRYLGSKLEATDINALLADYSTFAETNGGIRLIRDALRLSAHVLVKNHAQLKGQLWGRLLERDEPEIKTLLRSAGEQISTYWLRPRFGSLTKPGESLFRTIEHPGVVTALAIVDSQRVASGSDHGVLNVWDLESGQAIIALEGHTKAISSLSRLGDHRIVSGSYDGTAIVWNLETMQIEKVLFHNFFGINVVATLPDRRIITGSYDGTLQVWDAESGEILCTLQGHASVINALAVLDDYRVVSGSGDKVLKIWDVNSGETLCTLAGHSLWVSAVASLDAGRIISGSGDRTLRVWDVESGQLIRVIEECSKVTALTALGSDYIVSGLSDGKIEVRDIEDGKSVRTFVGHSRIRALAISGLRIISGASDETLRVWESGTGENLPVQGQHSDGIGAIEILDADRIITGSNDGTLRLWDIETGRSLYALESGSHWVKSIKALNCSQVVSGSSDGALHVWDLDKRERLYSLQAHSAGIRALEVLDSERVISGAGDTELKIWDIRRKRHILSLEGHSQWIGALAILADGRIVSGAGDGILRLWDLMSKRAQQVFSGASSVRAAIVLDDRRIISGSGDSLIREWDIGRGEVIRTFRGHSSWINALALFGRQHFISGSGDRTIRVWNLGTQESICRFTLDAPVSALAVIPGSSIIVAGDASGRVHFFDLVDPNSN